MSSNFLILCSASDTNSSLVSWIFFSSSISCFLHCLKSWHRLFSLWCILNRSSYLCCSAPSSFSTQVAFSEKKELLNLAFWHGRSLALMNQYTDIVGSFLPQCTTATHPVQWIWNDSASFKFFPSFCILPSLFFFCCSPLLSVCGRTAE